MSRGWEVLRLGFVLLVVTASGSLCADAPAVAEPPSEEARNRLPMRIAVGTVLWHDQLGDPIAAFESAERWRLRDVHQDAPELTLAQASAAFQMGWFEVAETLLEHLEPEVLHPDQRRSLYLLRARHAFESGQLAELETALAALSGRRDRKIPQVAFLAAELERQRGHLDAAEEHLRRIPKRHVLRAYAELNVGLDALEGEPNRARKLLDRVLDRSPEAWMDGAEARAIRDRARLGLAALASAEGKTEDSEKHLGLVSPGELAPEAVAQLARGASAAGRWSDAAKLWRYLIEQHADRPEIAGAWTGYPASIERVATREVSWTAYLWSAEQLESERDRLSGLRARNPLAESMHEAPTWRHWLAGSAQWQSLHALDSFRSARSALQERQADLAALTDVAREQQRRAAEAAKRMSGLDAERLQALIDRQKALLAGVNSAVADDDVPFFATTDERRQLAELSGLIRRFEGAGPEHAARAVPRINRMRGLIRYRIAAEIPARAEARRAKLRTLAETASAVRSRTELVLGVAAASEGETGHLAGLTRLSGRADVLLAAAVGAQARAEAEVLAGWHNLLDHRIAALTSELAQLHLAMARIGDEQLMIAAGHSMPTRAEPMADATLDGAARPRMFDRVRRWLTPWRSL